MQVTNNQYDFALKDPNMMFVVQIDENTLGYTRDGSFKELNNQLITGDGKVVLSANGGPIELVDGEISEYVVKPEDFGLSPSPLSELVIDNSQSSLELLKKALNGEHEGASNIVILNAGAAIYVAGLCNSLGAGVEMAQDAIGSGLAKEKMSEFVNFTQQVAG
jgi:anthranilate phosphoribosyltransferase